MFVSLLIAAGKSPKYIAEQAGHASAGFTFDRYGQLLETMQVRPVEWPEDLVWLSGFPHNLRRQSQTLEHVVGPSSESIDNKRSQS